MAAVNSKVDPVAAAYGAIDTPGRLSGLVDRPLASEAFLTGLPIQNASTFALTGEEMSAALHRNINSMEDSPIKVGLFVKEYPGYRKMTSDELRTTDMQTVLIQTHMQYNGWPLLETPIRLKSIKPLCVEASKRHQESQERIHGFDVVHKQYVYGDVYINGSIILNKNYENVLMNTYIAIDGEDQRELKDIIKEPKKVSWQSPYLWEAVYAAKPSEMDPDNRNRLCLYVKNDFDPKQYGGSRRSRKHKRSKRVRKQKKRTRKH